MIFMNVPSLACVRRLRIVFTKLVLYGRVLLQNVMTALRPEIFNTKVRKSFWSAG